MADVRANFEERAQFANKLKMFADERGSMNVLVGIVRHRPVGLAERCKIVKFDLGAFNRERLRWFQNKRSSGKARKSSRARSGSCLRSSSIGVSPVATAMAFTPFALAAR